MMRRKWTLPTIMLAVFAGLLWLNWPRTAPDTGARQIAQRYLDAFCRQDWPAAYALLDPQTRDRLTAERFTRWAANFRARLGFDPQTSFVHSCEEVADRAIASAALGGHAGKKEMTKNLTVTLRRGPAGWAVLPPEAALHPQTKPSR